MNFREKYPLSMKQVMYSLMVFRENIPFFGKLKYPSLQGIRSLAEYAGFSYNAVRTALTRERASGQAISFRDNEGKLRYRLTNKYKAVSRVVEGQFTRPEGFLLAVFSFKKENERERKIVRDTLHNFGFKRIAQNTYINGRVETGDIIDIMREEGIDRNLYLFNCPDIEDPVLKEKIIEVFDMNGRKRFLEEFFTDMKEFLNEKGISGEESARRVFYLGPVQYMKCFVEEPPFPERYLPKDYPLHRIQVFFENYIRRHGNRIAEYYSKVNY